MMELEKLLLKKNELPIIHENLFLVPIHPKLLDEKTIIDPKIANKVFPEAAKDWYNDLKKYAETIEDKEKKEWINNSFLSEGYEIKKEMSNQSILNGSWKDDVLTTENGFATSFSINRDFGGSIYYPRYSFPTEFVEFNAKGEYILFSEEKVREFSEEIPKIGNDEGGQINVYGSHNVDDYPGALFLRNWAILYMNEVFKQIFK